MSIIARFMGNARKKGGGDKSKPQILVNANQLTSTVQLHKSCSTAVPRFT